MRYCNLNLDFMYAQSNLNNVRNQEQCTQILRENLCTYSSLSPDHLPFRVPRLKRDYQSVKSTHFRWPSPRHLNCPSFLELQQPTISSCQPPFIMPAITYLRKCASVLLLTTIAFSNRSWQNPAQVRRALAHLRESGEELGISIENQLALIPRGDQAADQTRLISSASGSSSDLSLELHTIATILLNLNLASRSGSANPPVR